eukprot:symbB.v1.2.026560.t1/scaffold2599.1/size75162/3
MSSSIFRDSSFWRSGWSRGDIYKSRTISSSRQLDSQPLATSGRSSACSVFLLKCRYGGSSAISNFLFKDEVRQV